MRLWSIHPQYLDAKGLVALWREGLLAQKVLKGETRGYINHPQLDRFKSQMDPIAAIGRYLYYIHKESLKRGYSFNLGKIDNIKSSRRMTVNSRKVDYEQRHLLTKLQARDRARFLEVRLEKELEVHPLFRVIEGEIREWEVRK